MKSLLIVDDDREFVLRFIEQVGRKGVMISFADTLEKANFLINNNKFDYIFANVKIPGGNSLVLKNNFNKNNLEKPQIYFMSNIEKFNKKINEIGERCFYKNEITTKIDSLLQ